ncbi:hypothetical protein BS50DRAFT_587731 [Corynespora cassiicola Philippines]|uniref:Uncharacterized protein n=1 Tax=Corynespora cassiicola Philippines TaxID=1448308 RepID=A0A2T2NMH3_CORCC|nr:hypothetical protein BS50DRAFT_587731 [Corynespora cassiicola Philippines]
MPPKEKRLPSITSSLEESMNRMSLLIEQLGILIRLLEEQKELPATLPTEQLYHLTTMVIKQIESADESPEEPHTSPSPSIVQQSRILTRILIARLEQHADLPTEKLMQLVTSMIKQLDTLVEPSKPPKSWAKNLSEQLRMLFALISEQLRMLFSLLYELINMLIYPLLVVGLILFLSWHIRLQCRKVFAPRLIEHPLVEKFHPDCPPNFRYYPNYEKVLGMEERLYPTLAQPNSRVEKYYKQGMKCWHADKLNKHKGLSKDAMEEILKLIEDSRDKLKKGTGYPRLLGTQLEMQVTNVKEGGKDYGKEVYRSEYWNTTVETSLALYNNSAPCTPRIALSRLFDPASAQMPTSEKELGSHHACNIKTVARQYYFAYRNPPPPEFPLWGNALGWGPFDVLYWAYGTRLGWYSAAPRLMSIEEKERLVSTGWFDRSKTYAKGNLPEEVKRKHQARVEEIIAYQVNLYSYGEVFLSDYKPKDILHTQEEYKKDLRKRAEWVADDEFGLVDWIELYELPLGWWASQVQLVKRWLSRKNSSKGGDADPFKMPPRVLPPSASSLSDAFDTSDTPSS